MSNCQVTHNNSTELSGGGIFISNQCNNISLSSINISSNYAQKNGGGIAIY